MLQGCAGGGAVAAGLALLLLAAAGGACVWRWRPRARPRLALPGFLRRRRRGGLAQALPAGAKAPAARPGAAEPQGHYENLPAGRAPGLYENAGRRPREEPVYGNEAAGDYYNFHAPGAPASPQDEDIYILPDAY